MIPSNVTGDQIDDSLLKSIAVEGFIRELGLNETDEMYLLHTIDVKELQPGSTIIQEGDIEVCFMQILLKIFFIANNIILI